VSSFSKLRTQLTQDLKSDNDSMVDENEIKAVASGKAVVGFGGIEARCSSAFLPQVHHSDHVW